MSRPVYQVLQRHIDQWGAITLLGNGQELADDWQQQLLDNNSQVISWDWQTYQAYHQLDNEHKHFAMPSAELLSTERPIVLLWPKSKALGQALVRLIASVTSQCYIVAANDAGGKSIGKACSEWSEHSEKIDSARRCSLWSLTLKSQPALNWLSLGQSFSHNQQSYITLPGVFNHGKLDIGTQVLLEYLPAPKHGKVLDLGCGSGVIGLSLKSISPELDITLADVDAFALRSAQLNSLRLNQNAEILASDGLAQVEGRFDYLITNPPFHQGKDTDYQFAQQLFQQASRHLVADGQLWLVANRHLAYEEWAQAHFHQVEVMAQQQGFKVLCISQAKV